MPRSWLSNVKPCCIIYNSKNQKLYLFISIATIKLTFVWLNVKYRCHCQIMYKTTFQCAIIFWYWRLKLINDLSVVFPRAIFLGRVEVFPHLKDNLKIESLENNIFRYSKKDVTQLASLWGFKKGQILVLYL